MATASSEPAKLASGASGTPSHCERRREGDGEHRAKRRAGGDAERERRRERIAEQALEDDAGGSERRTDQRAGERSRQPCDEEDLRVGLSANGIDQSNARRRLIVVEPTSGAVTSASSSSAAEQRAAPARRRPIGFTASIRPGVDSYFNIFRCRARSTREAHGEAGGAVPDHVDVDVVERADALRRQDRFRRPRSQHPAVLQHHERVGRAAPRTTGRASRRRWSARARGGAIRAARRRRAGT